jgi:hypothetical protein
MLSVGTVLGEFKAQRARQMAEAITDATAARIGGLGCARPDCREQTVTLTATPASHPQIDYWATRHCAACGVTDGPAPMSASALSDLAAVHGGAERAKVAEAATVAHRRLVGV